jgi:hypothetical protein
MHPTFSINPKLPRHKKAHRRRKGQAITEFALILPLLLLLIFGIIEFARLFQAYLVVVNSARFGVRYAVTGEFEPGYCTDVDGNGTLCSGASENQEIDIARLDSIHEVVNGVAVAILKDGSASEGQPGFFQVTVCSSRTGFQYDRVADRCNPTEDPGDPEEGPTRVLVAVTFQHPLILPFLNNLWPSVRLHAERTGILENFRVARVLGLPPDIEVPTATNPPTMTPTPSETPTETVAPILTSTPTETATLTPTETPTQTPTQTATETPTQTPTQTTTETPTRTPTLTPTPVASCDDLIIDPDENIFFSGDDLSAWMQNASTYYQAELTDISTSWNGGWHDQVVSAPSDMSFDAYYWNSALILNPSHVSLRPAKVGI